MNERKKIFPSLLVALYINVSLINTFINIVAGFTIMQYLYIALGILILLNIIWNFKKISIYGSAVGMASLLLGYYFMSYSKTYLSVLYFMSYVMLPMVISVMDFDMERILRYIIITSIPMIFVGNKAFEVDEFLNNISMGMTYTFLPCICATIVHYKYFRNISGKFMYIAYAVNLYYITHIIMYGSRGPILAIVLLVIAMWIYDFDVRGRLKINLILAFLLMVFAIVTVMNYEAILIWIQKFLASYNISLNFINKIIRMSKLGDVSNGRMYLYELAFKHFLQAPIMGHGISTFAKYTNEVYPHNAILQFMFDGGILMTFFVVGMIISRSKRNLKSTDVYGFAFYLYLFFTSVPTSMLSGDIFTDRIFWLYVFMLMNNKFIKESEVKKQSYDFID